MGQICQQAFFFHPHLQLIEPRQTCPPRSTNSPKHESLSSFLGNVLGVYAGWSTAAVWLNAATLLPSDVFEGNRGVLIQCLFVGGAAASATAGSYLLRGQVAYTAAAAWALIGVAASGVRE